MKTPRFWSTKNPLSTALLPLSWLYALGARLRWAFTKPKTLSVPIICIGNLTAGGAGKTPVALAIGEMLKARHLDAFYISRGYGGSAKGPVLVDVQNHSAKEVGDEPLLLAQMLPTVVGKNRVEAAKFAIAQGAKIIVMDDGFQNPTLTKTLSLIVVDRRLSFGNERIIPAGPLRETVKRGLARADAIIIVNPANFLPTALPHIPMLIARSTPAADAQALAGKKLLAFCGIAYPKKFYRMLNKVGAMLAAQHSYPDHYHYTRADLEFLRAEAKKHDAILVTTAKDATRLPEAFKREVTVAHMELAFEHPAQLQALLERALA